MNEQKKQRNNVTNAKRIRRVGHQPGQSTEIEHPTWSDRLLQELISLIAGCHSRDRAAALAQGRLQKARAGGTPFRAPLGYQPVSVVDDGRHARSLEIDPERGPLVRRVFEMYADGLDAGAPE